MYPASQEFNYNNVGGSRAWYQYYAGACVWQQYTTDSDIVTGSCSGRDWRATWITPQV